MQLSCSFMIRMEKIDIKKRHSQAKIIGTLVTVIGALIMILYKGPIVEFIWNKGRHLQAEAAAQNDTHWLLGTLMLLFSCCCWSAFFVLQVCNMLPPTTEAKARQESGDRYMHGDR